MHKYFAKCCYLLMLRWLGRAFVSVGGRLLDIFALVQRVNGQFCLRCRRERLTLPLDWHPKKTERYTNFPRAYRRWRHSKHVQHESKSSAIGGWNRIFLKFSAVPKNMQRIDHFAFPITPEKKLIIWASTVDFSNSSSYTHITSLKYRLRWNLTALYSQVVSVCHAIVNFCCTTTDYQRIFSILFFCIEKNRQSI